SNGDGTFSSPRGQVTLAASGFASPWMSSLADVDGDGRADLGATQGGTGDGYYAWVALSSGDGAFSSAHGQGTLAGAGFASPWMSSLADVDGDGRADLVATHVGTGDGYYAWVALSSGDGASSSPHGQVTLAASGFASPWMSSLADVDGDGRADL